MHNIQRSMIFEKLNKHQNFTLYKEVGDRVCTRLKNEDIIIIRPNKKFNLLWGLGFILAGIFISLFLLKGEGQINAVTITMITVPGLFFVIVGILYIYKVMDKSLWIVDTKTRTFNFNNKQILPFDEISTLKITSSTDYSSTDTFNNRKVHELQMFTNRNLKMNLFQSESYDEIFEAGKLLSETMNKRLN